MVKPRAAAQDGTGMHAHPATGQTPGRGQPQPRSRCRCSFHPLYLNTSRDQPPYHLCYRNTPRGVFYRGRIRPCTTPARISLHSLLYCSVLQSERAHLCQAPPKKSSPGAQGAAYQARGAGSGPSSLPSPTALHCQRLLALGSLQPSVQKSAS